MEIGAPKQTNAIEALAEHLAQINRLNSLTPMLRGAAQKLNDEISARVERQEWEAEKNLSGLRAIATWPVSCAGVMRWQIGAGVDGKLLVVFNVDEWRGERHASILFGSCPLQVELDICRAYSLRKVA